MKRAATIATLVVRDIRNIILLLVCVCVVVESDLSAHEGRFERGDANGDRELDVSDPIAVLLWLFLGEPALPCEDAADSNDDGAVNIADAAYCLSFLFDAGPPPPAPYPDAARILPMTLWTARAFPAVR